MDWRVVSQRRSRRASTSGEAQDTIIFIARVKAQSPADAATLRTIISTASMQFPETLKAEFVKAASTVDELIAPEFEKVSEFTTYPNNNFNFGPGVSGSIGLDRKPDAVRFGDFEGASYTTPVPDDTAVEYVLGDDDVVSQNTGNNNEELTMEDVGSLALYDELTMSAATLTDDGFEWSAVNAALFEKKTLTLKIPAEILALQAEFEEVETVLPQLEVELNELKKTVNSQQTRSLKGDGVATQLNTQLATINNAIAEVKKKMEYTKQQIRNADTALSFAGGSTSDGTVNSTDTKSGSNTTIIIIIGVVLVMAIVGAIVFVVMRNNNNNGPRHYQNHPTTHQNPAYAAGPGQGGQPQQQQQQQQRPQGAQRPAGARPAGAGQKKPNVQQQGQRKVLVLDPYGNDA